MVAPDGPASLPPRPGVAHHRGRRWQQRPARAPLEVGAAAAGQPHGLALTICHFPQGTSKWNKIELRLFSYISTNWRGQPLVSLAVIVNLISSKRTAAGLRVRCELDRGRYVS